MPIEALIERLTKQLEDANKQAAATQKQGQSAAQRHAEVIKAINDGFKGIEKVVREVGVKMEKSLK